MEAFEQDIKKCIAAMEHSGTFLYPTDTIWGIGCDATDESAVEKVSQIKNRATHKSYIVLMPDVQMLRKHLANPIPDLEGFIEEQKGATTVVYNDIIGIAQNVLATDGSLGIRIPADDFCIGLLKRYRKPMISTSANLGGEASPAFFKEIKDVVKEKVDYVCQWRQADEEAKEPSRIIKLNADGSIVKIR